MAADGSFTIDAKLQTKDFTVSSRQLMTAIKNLEQSSKRTSAGMAKSASSYGNAMRTSAKAAREFNAELKRLENEAANLKAKLNEKGNRMIATDDFKQLIKDQQKAQTEYDKLIDKKNKMKIAGVAHDSKDMDKLYYDLAKAESKMDELRMKREEMLSSGKAYVGSKETAEYAELEMKYNAIADKIQDMREASQEAGNGFQIMARNAGIAAASLARMVGGAALSFLRKLAAGARNAAIQLMKLAGNAIKTGIQKIGQFAGGAAKKILGLGKATSKSNNGFKVGLMTILKYGLGIRSLYFLFRRLRQAITDGFNAIAQKDPQVKAALNSLQKALNGLKGSLATAFAPILTAIAPALTTLINLLTTAINAIGAFFAALTGKKTFAKSVGGLEATGKAAKGASGSVKELKNQLAGFDELEILKDSSGSGGGGGGGGSGSGLSYEMATIDSGISEFAEQLKAAWNASDFGGVGKIIANKINGAFEKAKKLISWDNIGGKVVEWIDKITGIFNGLVDGINWPLIGSTFATGTNTIVNTLNNWWSRMNTILPKLAKGLVDAFNQFLADTDFYQIGVTFATKVETMIRTALTAIKTADFALAGAKVADAINGFFENPFIWQDAGATIDAAIRGALNFGKRFLENFNEVQVANDIKTALKQIRWREIISSLWENAKLAAKKFGNFLEVLLGLNDTKTLTISPFTTVNFNAGGGEKKSIARALGEKIGALLAEIPWKSVFETVKETATEVISGLMTGLFGSEDGVFITKLAGALLVGKILFTGKTNSFAADLVKIIAGAFGTIISNFKLFGTLALLALDAQMVVYDYKKISDAAEGYKEAGQAYSNEIETALSNYKKLYKNKGKEVADEWAKVTYNVDTTGQSLEESQQTLVNRCTELWGDAPKSWWEALTKGFEHYFGKDGTGFEDFANDAVDSVRSALGLGPAWRSGNEKDNTIELSVEDNRTAWQKLDDTVAKALVENTKSTDKGTKEQSKATKHEQLAQKTGAKNYTPGAAKSWSDLEAEVPVNLTPGKGGASGVFASVGDWIKKSVAGGADSPIRTNLQAGKGGASGTFANVLNFLRQSFAAGTDTNARVNLVKADPHTTIQTLYGTALTVYSSLTKLRGSANVTDIYPTTLYINSVITTTANAINNFANNIKAAIVKAVPWLRAATGGVITSGGMFHTFAAGGVISSSGRASWWNGIPKYASGTGRAHGTLFAAGEAGPEVVGHIGGRTEVLNKSQLAQTMHNAVVSGIVTALSHLQFRTPAMASGTVMPYEIMAQQERLHSELRNTLDANNEDLINTIISVVGQQTAALVSAFAKAQSSGTGRGLSAQEVINEINRRTQMFSASPLKGV